MNPVHSFPLERKVCGSADAHTQREFSESFDNLVKARLWITSW
jgi:hypothetical protein